MKKKLHISENLSLPLDWIQLATVVYGARGSGKTSFGRVAAEEATAAGQRFCAIDLKGDWFGLRSSADGKKEGIPVVIFGGEHADVPLEPDAGAFVGETVARLGQSCILDFELFSKGKRIRFLAEFFEKLYHFNRDPLLLLLDEAQSYAPQKPGPDEARTLGAVTDLVKLGRKHGIGPVLFTQRGSGLNKECSEVCDVMVAFRTPGPLDQDRIEGWFGANMPKGWASTIMPEISRLPTGTAIFASSHPDLAIRSGQYAVRRPMTFDSSATPKIGTRKQEPKKLAKPDLEALKTQMSEAIERAKADDPKALRVEIARLKAELAKKPTVERVAVQEKVNWKRIADRVDTEVENLGELLKKRVNDIVTDERVLTGEFKTPMTPTRERPAPVASRQHKPTNGASNGSIGGGLRRMMIALAQRPGLTNRQLGVRAGLSSRSGTFSTYLSRGRSEGWIVDDGERRTLTPEGMVALGPWDPLPEGRALLEHWLGEIGGGANRMLAALADVYPKALTHEELGEAAQISHRSGTFSTYLSKLRTLELVEGRNELRLAEELS